MSTKHKSKNVAALITTICVLANLPLFLFLLFGPKEGMEELAVLFPWLLTGVVHILLVIPALLFAFHSRQHRANSWIYIYFLIFFGFHAVYLIHVNGFDTHLHQKFTAIWHADQAEFHKLLSELRYISPDEKISRVKELIHNGVDVNSMFPGDHQTGLQKAGYAGNAQIIKLILENGAPVDGPPAESTTALGWAVQQNHTEAARLLLANGAEPNKGVSGYSFLNMAVKNQNADIVAALLKAGADPNKRIYRPESPLMLAASNGYKTILKLLVEAGADLDYQLPEGITALVMAVKNGHTECVKILLDADAKLIGESFGGVGLLGLAATVGNTEIAEMIKTAAQSDNTQGADFNSSYRNRYLDLFNVLRYNRVDDFKKMLRIGIYPDSVFDDHGSTLLQKFCMDSLGTLQRVNVLEIVEILIDNGADINRRSVEGTTPLMNAARSGQTELVKLLIRNGADIHAMDKWGHGALYYARDHVGIVDALHTAGAIQR